MPIQTLFSVKNWTNNFFFKFFKSKASFPLLPLWRPLTHYPYHISLWRPLKHCSVAKTGQEYIFSNFLTERHRLITCVRCPLLSRRLLAHWQIFLSCFSRWNFNYFLRQNLSTLDIIYAMFMLADWNLEWQGFWYQVGRGEK